MHILVIPPWYPTEENPVKGSFFAEQARALADYGHTVTVVPMYPDAERGARNEEKRDANLTEYAIHYHRLPFHLTYVRILRAFREILGSRLRGDRPDIIHVHSFRPIRYARALKALYRIPFVVTEHVSWFQRGMIGEKQLRSISADYARADAVIAVSTGLKDQIQPLSPSEILVVPNLVSERFFSGGLHESAGEYFRFISVGNLDKNKGMDLVLRAFAYAAAVCPEIRLTVCGQGTEHDALVQQAEELEIADKVEFTGQVSRERCAELMRRSQAFVLGSRVETFGVVFVEAMACGLPIVMTQTGAWRELADVRTGLVVPTEDAHALGGAMVQLVRSSADYDPAVIREFCRERFSADAVCRRLTEIYQQVLEK